MKEAKARRDLIGGELAAGRNPADLLARSRRRHDTDDDDLDAWSERFLTSRIDIDANTTKNYRRR